jgi:hypothetical protein
MFCVIFYRSRVLRQHAFRISARVFLAKVFQVAFHCLAVVDDPAVPDLKLNEDHRFSRRPGFESRQVIRFLGKHSSAVVYKMT